MLDGHGKMLPAGQDPVVLGWEMYERTDFNKHDFGRLVSEEDCDSSEGL